MFPTRIDEPMQEQVTVVEPNGKDPMEFSVDEPGNSPPPQPNTKFVHASGSSPLEGYTIKRGVGHGGFGEIYYAITDAGKEVALKLIRRNLDIELRGIRHCLNLKHPNLLSLYDIRQDDNGDTWVVMEYVSGGSLADALNAHPNGMPVREAMVWFHGTAAGLAYLHDRGIVHRDIKPGNIFADEGLVKVGDYGLSKFISCSRRSGQTESVGTVHYMAPEVANGRYGKEIDVYAMGIMLYELLTGAVPFEGESVGEVLMKHLTAKPDVSRLAEPYRSVVAKALEKEPSRRYQSVGEMMAALPQPANAPGGTGRLPSSSGNDASGNGNPGSAHTGPLPGTEEPVQASAIDEEPILKAVQETIGNARKAWEDANLPTPVKVVILVLGILCLLVCSEILIPLGILLLLAYAVYRVVRTMVIGTGSASVATPSHAAPGTPGQAAPGGVHQPGNVPPVMRPQPVQPHYGPAYPKRVAKPKKKKPKSREAAAAALVVKSRKERCIELLGSMLGSALVALVACVIMVLLNSYFLTVASPQPEQFAWLALTGIAGAWSILIPSKFWEGTRGEAMMRRCVMMVIGLILGAFASGIATLFLVDFPVTQDFDLRMNSHMPPGFFGPDGTPLLLTFVGAFGMLFFALQWWKDANPLRGSHLSIISVFFTAVVAWLAASVVNFPQPWLPMVAIVISVAVQLSSPWIDRRKNQIA